MNPEGSLIGQPPSAPRVGAVVLGYGDEPLLDECLQSLLDDGVESLVLVDNGITSAPRLPTDPRLTVVTPGANTGFAGGCNLGAATLGDSCDVLVFANSDLVVRPGSTAALAAALGDPAVGLVCGLIVLYSDPATINSAGNPIHVSLMSWAGRWGDPTSSVPVSVDVPGASGALMAMRRLDWEATGGLWDELFAYNEDMELSLRVRQGGLAVRCVPAAVGMHDYAFSAGDWKYFLLERNRLAALLTLFDPLTLLALLPILAAVEAGVWLSAVRGGWAREKARGYSWLWQNRRQLAERRRWNASARRIPDTTILQALTPEITPSAETGIHVPPIVNRGFLAWYDVATRAISGRTTGTRPIVRDGDEAVLDTQSGAAFASAHLATRAPDTQAMAYTKRLQTKSGARWKQILDVQAPYRRHLQAMGLGRVLDVGCGIGRTMQFFDEAVGVDHNPDSIAHVRELGLTGWTADEWPECPDARPESFDTILVAHVLEHLDEQLGQQLLQDYLPCLRPGGRLVLICPQEAGQASDATHVRFLDYDDLDRAARHVGCLPESVGSFPFPRVAGRRFPYNESILVARKL